MKQYVPASNEYPPETDKYMDKPDLTFMKRFMKRAESNKIPHKVYSNNPPINHLSSVVII